MQVYTILEFVALVTKALPNLKFTWVHVDNDNYAMGTDTFGVHMVYDRYESRRTATQIAKGGCKWWTHNPGRLLEVATEIGGETERSIQYLGNTPTFSTIENALDAHFVRLETELNRTFESEREKLMTFRRAGAE